MRKGEGIIHRIQILTLPPRGSGVFNLPKAVPYFITRGYKHPEDTVVAAQGKETRCPSICRTPSQHILPPRDRRDGDAVAGCFSEHGVVKDEGRKHEGTRRLRSGEPNASANIQL